MKTAFVTRLAAVSLALLTACSDPDAITVRAGVLLDGRGGKQTAVDIVIRDGVITELRDPRGTPEYDLSDLTVLPGLIDTHVHINWHFDPDGKTHHLGPEEESLEEAVAYAIENARVTLNAGFTTVQSLGHRVDGELKAAIDSGDVSGPTVLSSLGQLSQRTGDAEALRERVRELYQAGADVIKIFGSASIRVGGMPTLSQEQLDAVCGEANTLGLRTAVHAHGPESAQRAVRAGCTVIEHGALLDRETLALMAERGTYYDPNIHLIFQNYFDNRDKYVGIGGYTDEGFAQMEATVPRALEAFKWGSDTPGLKIVFGTDAVAGAHGRNIEELIYRVETGGQDPMDAIVSATSLAAESLGMQNEIGTIAVGMTADIIAVRGDPSTTIGVLRNVQFVMKHGRVIRNAGGN